jgi:hypothetical protein
MPADDPVLVALAEAAIVLFPTIYAPDADVQGMSPRSPDAVRAALNVGLRQPSGQRVLDAIRGDPELSALLNPPRRSRPTSEGWEFGEMIVDNLGRAERRWTFELPGLLVESAARNVLAAGGPVDSVGPIIDELPGVLAQVRSLISGQTEHAYVGAAFANLRVPEGIRLSTPWGVLRCAVGPERSHRPDRSPEAWSILEADVPLVWTLGDQSDGASLGISEPFRVARERERERERESFGCPSQGSLRLVKSPYHD